jgi:tetratricopeptide (TPR) repeat protein
VKSFSTHLAVGLLLIAALYAGVYALSNFIESNRVPIPETYADEDLAFEGKKIKGFALGAEGMLADWYWIRSLQYIGDKLTNSKLEYIDLEDLTHLNPRLLYPLLDNATDLDPHFMAAYSYGAIVLPAIDKQQAIKLTEKGIAANPNEWRLHQYLGYIHWRLKNFEKAAEVYEQGSRVAGAPQFLSMMAAKMRADGGSRDTARQLYRQMADEATDEQTRVVGSFRLQQLDALDELDAINAELVKFRSSNGRCITTSAELISLLKNVRLSDGRDFRVDAKGNLVDPTGVPYAFLTTECKAVIDVKKSKIPAN